MPLYSYECQHGVQADVQARMGDAPKAIQIEHDSENCEAFRTYNTIQFSEDRRRFRKGRSMVTGEPYAQSRSEERVLEKTRGIEFLSPREMPKQWEKLRDYARHVKAGGERLDPHKVNPVPTTPKGEILKKMAERGVRFGA